MDFEDSPPGSPEKANIARPCKRLLIESAERLIHVFDGEAKHLIKEFIEEPEKDPEELLVKLASSLDSALEKCTDELSWTENFPVVQYFVFLIKCVVTSKTPIKDVAGVVNVVKTLVGTLHLAFVDSTFKAGVSTLAVNLIKKTNVSSHVTLAMSLLNYLLNVTLKGQTRLLSETNKLKYLKASILTLNFDNAALDSLNNRLMEALTCPRIVKSHGGAVVLGAYLSRKVEFVMEAQSKIRDGIRSMNKLEAQGYGNVLFNAWSFAENPDVKRAVEIHCIQDLISRIFFLKRGTLNMGKIGERVLSILHQLHLMRRHGKFSLVIAELYMPYIFRNLKNSNDAVRCNAAQVFFDVFPLELTGRGAAANSELYNAQLKEIQDLLVDECHYVRILALRGISHVLPTRIQLFQKPELDEILSIVSDRLASDGSSPQVRSAVFVALSELIRCEETRELVLPIVGKLRDHLHDESEIVRVSFVKLLLQMKSMDIKIWDFVQLTHVIFRLKEETNTVGTLIAKLIMPEIYIPGQALGSTFSKLVRLISISGEAAINLFRFSRSAISSEDAFNLVVAILGMLCSRIIDLEKNSIKNEGSPENIPSASESGRSAPKNRRRSPLRNIVNEPEGNSDHDSSSANSSCSSSSTMAETARPYEILFDFESIDVVFKIIGLLWYSYLDDFLNKKETLDRLYSICCTLLPFCQRVYSGKKVFYTVISFSSLIPINKLHNVSTTDSLCISQLKKLSANDIYELKCLIYALCAWNRGTDLLELITEALNETFRQVNMNNTQINRRRSGRVRFRSPLTCQPSVAIKSFQIMFNNKAIAAKELEQNYSAVHDAHRFLCRVKTVIENRLSRGEPFKGSAVDDEFLAQCFQLYLQSIFVLQCPGGIFAVVRPEFSTIKFNAGDAYRDVIVWAKETVVPCLPSESSPSETPCFAIQLIKVLLSWVKSSTAAGYSKSDHCVNMSEFFLTLLTTGCSMVWIEEIFSLITELSSYAIARDNQDRSGLLSLHIPRLLKVCLESLTTYDLSAKNFGSFVSAIDRFKVNFFATLKVVSLRFGSSSDVFKQVFQSYMVTCVIITAREISGDCDEEAVADIRRQHFVVTFILKFLLQNKSFADHILPTLGELMEKFKDDSLSVLSCIKLLTIVTFSGQLNGVDDEVRRCFDIVETRLREFRLSKTRNDSRMNDTTFSGHPVDITAVSEKMLTDMKEFLMIAAR